jgi:hypothetical protein
MAKTEVAIFNPSSNVPTFARKQEASALAKALSGGGNTGKRISVKGGVFRLYDSGKEVTAIDDRFLDVVIVNAAPKIARTYYAGTYVEGTVSAPDCWSPDGDKPDASSKNVQATACATCPQNAKGSGQGDSRACRFSQRVAVVLANDVEGDVMQLSLAATSIFGKEEGDKRPLQAYARWLAAQGIDPSTLVTRLQFDTSAATPKLFFKAMRWLSQEEYETCQAQGKSPDAIQAVTMTVAQMDGVRNEAANTGPSMLSSDGAPRQAPKPQAEEEEETAAPAVRKASTAKAGGAVKGSSLAATVAAWDTDD